MKWNLVPLGTVCTVSSSKRIFAKEYRTEGIPFYRGKEVIEKHKGNPVSTELFISKERYEEIRCKYDVPQIGDILLTSVGTLGVSWLVDETEFYFKDGNLTWLRAKDGLLNKFLYLWLNSDDAKHQIDMMCIGSTQKALTIETINKFVIPLPSMQEQESICAVIYPIIERIKNNRQINDNLQQQAATVFHQWFVANPESEKWPSVTLDSLTSLVSRGIAPKYTDDSTQIVLNQKCIRDHYIDISLARRHNPKVINEKWLQYGDLLINSTGEGTLGRAAQVWFVPENMTVDSHVTIVRPKDPHLLFYIGLWGISHEREIEALHTGSTGQTELPRERVKAMELRLPDNDTLARFNAVISPIVSLIITNQQENVRLASVRDSLPPKLMSGEIDVSDIQL